MKLGIIGLENAGKKTIFSLLTGKKEFSYAKSKEEIGIIDVPDERVDFLAEYYKTTKKVYSRIEFALLPSITKDPEQNKKVLLEAKEVDLFAFVIRQFEDNNVFHPYENVDILRDFSIIKNEFILADLFIIETRLERVEKQILRNKTDLLIKEKEILIKLKEHLEQENFLNKLDITKDELKVIQSFDLLTLRPIFVIVNCDEEKINNEFNFPEGIRSINFSAKIEKEIQELNEQDKQDFLGSIGLKESGLNRLIKFSYNFANLISFFTASQKESHSWTIKKGTTALNAAGTIHSDLQRGFIRAEVISFDDFKSSGSELEAKKRGLYRLEGKDYIIKDGDIIYFRVST